MGRSRPLGQLRRRSANVSAQRTFDQAAASVTKGGKCAFAALCTNGCLAINGSKGRRADLDRARERIRRLRPRALKMPDH